MKNLILCIGNEEEFSFCKQVFPDKLIQLVAPDIPVESLKYDTESLVGVVAFGEGAVLAFMIHQILSGVGEQIPVVINNPLFFPEDVVYRGNMDVFLNGNINTMRKELNKVSDNYNRDSILVIGVENCEEDYIRVAESHLDMFLKIFKINNFVPSDTKPHEKISAMVEWVNRV